VATQKDRYVSLFLPRLQAPPVPPPPSSSTEDDSVLYSLQPQFAASSISSSFSFSPDCPGMNSDVRERRAKREGKAKKERKRERERGTWQRTPDDGFGGTREIEGERNDRWLPW